MTRIPPRQWAVPRFEWFARDSEPFLDTVGSSPCFGILAHGLAWVVAVSSYD